jgi:hypothetical protein
VSSFQVLSASNIFLIVILLDAPFPFSIRTRPIGNTFAVLFQLKRFFIYSDLFLQLALYVISPRNRFWRCWRLLSSGFRSVLVNPTDRSLRLKIRLVSRDLVPRDRATCTIASTVNFFITSHSLSTVDSQGCYHNQCHDQHSNSIL